MSNAVTIINKSNNLIKCDVYYALTQTNIDIKGITDSSNFVTLNVPTGTNNLKILINENNNYNTILLSKILKNVIVTYTGIVPDKIPYTIGKQSYTLIIITVLVLIFAIIFILFFIKKK